MPQWRALIVDMEQMENVAEIFLSGRAQITVALGSSRLSNQIRHSSRRIVISTVFKPSFSNHGRENLKFALITSQNKGYALVGVCQINFKSHF